MANYTPNYNLYKPDIADNDVEVAPSLKINFETIDTELKNRKDDVETHQTENNAHESSKIKHGDGTVQDTLFELGGRIDGAESDIEEVDSRISTIVAQAGTDNTEIVDARGGFTVLHDRLENVDLQLAEKAKKGEQFIFVKDYGAVGDGVTDDTIAIQIAINYANANNLSVLFEPKEYLISQIVFKKARYYLKGTSFKMKDTLTGNIYALDFESGAVADYVQLNIPSATMGERFIRVQGGCIIDYIKVNATAQQTTLNDNLDGAVNITGSNHWIGNIEVTNCDYAVVLYNVLSSFIGRVKVENYIRGVYVRQSKDVQVNTIRTSVMSPNAGQNPGHNGLLIEECEDIRFPVVYVSDSGEHGVRVGGINGGVYLQKRISFGQVVTRRTGQCGFKAMSGSTALITYLSISSLHVYDCAYANTPGTNEDGAYLVNCQHVNIGQFFLDSELNAVSAYDGFYASGCQFIQIGTMNIRNVSNNGLLIDQVNGTGLTNDLYVESVSIRKCGAEAIYINHMTDILRDIIIKGIYIREFGLSSYGVKVMANSTTVGANQPVLVDGYVSKGNSTGIFFTNTTDTDVYNKLTQLT